jgi:AraC-like DNA-binding protein
MKAAYEHVDIARDCSVRVYHRKLPRIPFEWHHHPEYELTLTTNSCGRRYIGDSVTDYGEHDLVLVPPDLPHTWSSNRSIARGLPQEAIVVWFEGEWVRRLASCCPEYESLRRLLHRAGCGLAFGNDAGVMMRRHAAELVSPCAITRLRAVLDVLCQLADETATPLASPNAFAHGGQGQPSGRQPEQLNRVLATIDARFMDALTLDELAAAGAMSLRSLNRTFQRHLGESAGRYLTRTRIAHACRLLSDTSLPITVIASRSGYTSLANFNRQFKQLKGNSPSAWRTLFASEPQAGPLPVEQRPTSLEPPARGRRRPAPAE